MRYVLTNPVLCTILSAKLLSRTLPPDTQMLQKGKQTPPPSPHQGISNPFSCLRIREPFILNLNEALLVQLHHTLFHWVSSVQGWKSCEGEHPPPCSSNLPPAPLDPAQSALQLQLPLLPFFPRLSNMMMLETGMKLMAMSVRTADL